LFAKVYELKYLKAAICLQKDRNEMMVFNFPPQHWQSIQTSTP
jgi:putative transposase